MTWLQVLLSRFNQLLFTKQQFANRRGFRYTHRLEASCRNTLFAKKVIADGG